MPTTSTRKGQVTIPKRIRDALGLDPGCLVDFAMTGNGDVVIHKAGARPDSKPDRAYFFSVVLVAPPPAI